MSCKDYIELKPGMEVLITDPIYGLSNEKVVVKKLEAIYCVENANIGIGVVFDVNGKEYSVFYPMKISITIKPCRKVQVKDLCVGDVIERDDNRGMITYKDGNWVNVLWYKETGDYSRSMSYDVEITDAEVVGHVDLWNL